MNLQIQEITRHRNGVCGNPFYVVLFTLDTKEIGLDNGKEEKFLATLFDDPGSCAVIGLDRIETMGVSFAEGNSWRGDHFEDQLRKIIANGSLQSPYSTSN